MEMDFIRRITGLAQEHLSDEQFGVSELAREAGMSRSSLLRNIKAKTGLSASQFIRQLRLERSRELLEEGNMNVSEIAFACGFNSTSYFSRCFHEHYGFPPGEAGMRKQEAGQADSPSTIPEPAGKASGRRVPAWASPLILAVLLVLVILLIFLPGHPLRKRNQSLEKSIAVLPFRNESPDSDNIYLINGLMESLLGDLQKISDLRVISRTSVEKYRDLERNAQEIGQELDANYLVTGSGQKQGDKILLHVRLIEAPGDKQVWSGRYLREYSDIFKLQIELAGDIAGKIEALVTPDEKTRLEKRSTDNLLAYDYFLQGLDQFRAGNAEGLSQAIVLFEKALAEDPDFADPHALTAISYGLMDLYSTHKPYRELSRNHADRALLLDPYSARSLVSKAVSHISVDEHERSLPYLEKALEYNPNSSMVINALSDYYTHHAPHTGKYLEYALRGLRLDLASHDSTEASILLLHVSNALVQSGFVEESEDFLQRSLNYDPENLYAETLRGYIQYARTGELEACRDILRRALQKDSTHYELLKELGIVSYYLRDYPTAHEYFKIYFGIFDSYGLDLSGGEFGKFSVILRETGQPEAAEKYLDAYRDFALEDVSRYHHLSMAAYHAQKGDADKSLEAMRLFAEEENYPYWYILFLEDDPLFETMYSLPEFQEIMEEIQKRFWEQHRKLRASLQARGIL